MVIDGKIFVDMKKVSYVGILRKVKRDGSICIDNEEGLYRFAFICDGQVTFICEEDGFNVPAVHEMFIKSKSAVRQAKPTKKQSWLDRVISRIKQMKFCGKVQ